MIVMYCNPVFDNSFGISVNTFTAAGPNQSQAFDMFVIIFFLTALNMASDVLISTWYPRKAKKYFQ